MIFQTYHPWGATIAPAQPAILPEDRPRVAAETICALRAEGRTDREITALLRTRIAGITDDDIVNGYKLANARCPQMKTPIIMPNVMVAPTPPPPPLPETIPPPPPYPPPTTVEPAPSRIGKYLPWMIAGGLALGVIAVAVIATRSAKKTA